MDTLWDILSWVASIASLVCFIWVLVKMFQNGKIGLGIACIVLAFCLIGFLIAFIYGWVKSRDWGLSSVMLVWTACIAIGILGNVMHPVDVSAIQKQFQPH